MLVLSRHKDEGIMIGDDIKITVVDIRGDKVRLGIEAPTNISVHRQEVYDAIQRENTSAGKLEKKTEDTDSSKPSGSGGGSGGGYSSKGPSMYLLPYIY